MGGNAQDILLCLRIFRKINISNTMFTKIFSNYWNIFGMLKGLEEQPQIYNSQDTEATKCPSTDKWMKKMWYIYIYNGILLSHKKSENLPFAITWMD